MKAGEIGAPEKLSVEHDRSGFDSGQPALDEWLRRRALQNEASGASRTYVVGAGKRIAGYYTLAVGAVARAEAVAGVNNLMLVFGISLLALTFGAIVLMAAISPPGSWLVKVLRWLLLTSFAAYSYGILCASYAITGGRRHAWGGCPTDSWSAIFSP